MELFKRKKKKDDKLSDLKKQGFDLEIEDVSQDDSGGYIFSQGMYRKILMIFPINSDFLETEVKNEKSNSVYLPDGIFIRNHGSCA